MGPIRRLDELANRDPAGRALLRTCVNNHRTAGEGRRRAACNGRGTNGEVEDSDSRVSHHQRALDLGFDELDVSGFQVAGNPVYDRIATYHQRARGKPLHDVWMMIASDGFEVAGGEGSPDGCIGLVQSRFIRLRILGERCSGERHHQRERKKAR